MKKKVYICACASRFFIDQKQVTKLASAMHTAGYEVNLVDDLCKMVQQQDKRLAEMSQTTVVACHERAVMNLLRYAGVEAGQLFDIRSSDAQQILTQLGVDQAGDTDAFVSQLSAMKDDYGHDAWFPVIDRDRCINCRKCHDFCLFGVYAIEDKQVKVVHPENCKNNCPACARTCPKTAVIFPKYNQSPINGGKDEAGDTAIRIDTKALYNQALRERLASRRAGAFLINNKK